MKKNCKKIVYVIGMSCSGKDTLIAAVKDIVNLSNLTRIKFATPVTTRPKRPGETNEYIFTNNNDFDELSKKNKLVDVREYNTVQGLWKYANIIPDGNEWDTLVISSTPEGILNNHDINLHERLDVKKVYIVNILVPKYQILGRLEKRKHVESIDYWKEALRRYISDSIDYSYDSITNMMNILEDSYTYNGANVDYISRGVSNNDGDMDIAIDTLKDIIINNR